MERERPKSEGRSSGRRFTENRIARSVLLFGLAIGALYLADEGPGIVESGVDVFRDRFSLESTRECYADPLEGEKGRLMVTSPLPDNSEILIRSEPNLSDDTIVGIADPGIVVQARPYCGTVYPGEDGLGKIDGPDDEGNGKWFRLVGITVHNQKGTQEEKAVYDVFIAGNFLRLPTEQEKADFYTSSE